jgi:streptogrisin D
MTGLLGGAGDGAGADDDAGAGDGAGDGDGDGDGAGDDAGKVAWGENTFNSEGEHTSIGDTGGTLLIGDDGTDGDGIAGMAGVDGVDGIASDNEPCMVAIVSST